MRDGSQAPASSRSRLNVTYLSARSVYDVLEEGIRFLESAGVPEADISAGELLSQVLHRPRLSLCLEPDLGVERRHERRFQELLAKRAARYPLQYLIQTIPFRRTLLWVGEGCFIPRPETEVLVDAVLRQVNRPSEPLSVLDVGTGSGNIAISLAVERPQWRMTATDISPEALRYAKANAVRNRVEKQIDFVRAHFWDETCGRRFDAVVSNPPYLTERELANLQPEITFEPRIALAGGADGLLFFKRIVGEAKKVLKKRGFIFFEAGAGQAQTVASLLDADGFELVAVSRDHAGIERIVSGRLLNHGSR